MVKKPSAMQETSVRSLGWEDLLEEGKATHQYSGFPDDSVGKKSARNAGDTADVDLIPEKAPWRRKWQPTLVFWLGKISWTEEPD